MDQNLGKFVATRTVETKELFNIPRGMVVEVVKTATGRHIAKVGGATFRITKSDIAGGGALLHHTYAEVI